MMEDNRMANAEGQDLSGSFLQRGRRWVLFILGWTVLSLLFLPETYLYFLYRHEAIPLTGTLALTLVNSAIALSFLPGIVWLTRRYPFDQARWRRALLVHLPACMVFSLSYSWLYAGLCYAAPSLFHMLFIRFHPNILTYWAIVGFTQAVDYFGRYRERERQLAQAELHLLKSQLHPHFLFNTLHAISAMMHEDVKGADRMINRLSEMLRLVLESGGKHEITLKQEIEFLQSYLEIERIRFQERLALTLDVEPTTLDAVVPSMLLQPLAENSIRHGFGSHKNSGVIRLEARHEGNALVLRFIDNGKGFTAPNGLQPSHNLGLSNIRRRLEQLYGNQHELRIENPAGGGAIIIVRIPYHTRPNEETVMAELIENENTDLDRGRRALGAQADRYVAEV